MPNEMIATQTQFEEGLKAVAEHNKDVVKATADANGDLFNTGYSSTLQPYIAFMADVMVEGNDAITAFPDYFTSGFGAATKENVFTQAVVDYMISPANPGPKDAAAGLHQKYSELSLIALSIVFNKAFVGEENDVAGTCIAIGKAIEQHMMMNQFIAQKPKVYAAFAKNHLKDVPFGYHFHMNCLVKSLVEHADFTAPTGWSISDDEVYAKLGGLLLAVVFECKLDNKPLFIKDKEYGGGPKATNVVTPSDALAKIVVDKHDAVVANAFVKYPMIEEPLDWTATSFGGYHSNAALQMPLIRHKTETKVDATPGEIPIAFINNLQKVKLKVNSDILAIADEVKALGLTVGKFVSVPLTGTKGKKIVAAKRAQPTLALASAAQMFAEMDEFFLPWSFDTRGRAYPQATTLISQSSDFGKALIKFAEPGPVTPAAKKWLAIHLANCFGNGVDKLSLADRIAWTKANHRMIAIVARNPLAVVKKWVKGSWKINGVETEMPSDPWMFIAACMEYTAVVIDKSKDTTDLMVATDATCSGMQINAALMGDENAAKWVNVIGSDVPMDAYGYVAGLAKELLLNPDWIASHDTNGVITDGMMEAVVPYLTRKVAKPVVMTLFYNAGEYSQKDAVKKVLVEMIKDSGKQVVPAKDIWFIAQLITQALRETLEKAFPEVIGALKQITVLTKTAQKDKSYMTWTTPSGFVAMQHKCKVDNKRVELPAMGITCVVSTKVLKDGKEVTNPQGHGIASVPNFTHSLDSSLLHLSFASFDKPFSLIHDSVLTRACDMDEAVLSLKTNFVKMFTECDPLADFAKDVGIDPALLPAKGDLNVSQVMDSDYFFS